VFFKASMTTISSSSAALRGVVLATVLATLGSVSFADQQLLAAQSEIGFVSKQMGVPVEGHFRKFDAQITFDPARPQASRIAFTVDVTSATLGSPESDAELPKAAWFNAAKFSQATFQSSAMRSLGPGKFEVVGKLGIKGSLQDVVVPVALTQAGATTTATGSFLVKRLAFRIGEGEWADTSMVADEVLVKFRLTLTGVGKI
jgi:polyisoprenoid-binding protein YceI